MTNIPLNMSATILNMGNMFITLELPQESCLQYTLFNNNLFN